MTIVYLDTETTGIDPTRHQVWEIAYAVDDGPVHSGIVPHTTISAERAALDIGRYDDRTIGQSTSYDLDGVTFTALTDATLCGANPAFDAAFLRARWGQAPWRYRLLDVEAYAMGALGYDETKGLKTIRDDLVRLDYEIPEPDHTAAGDVATVRACHQALRDLYKMPTKWVTGVDALIAESGITDTRPRCDSCAGCERGECGR